MTTFSFQCTGVCLCLYHCPRPYDLVVWLTYHFLLSSSPWWHPVADHVWGQPERVPGPAANGARRTGLPLASRCTGGGLCWGRCVLWCWQYHGRLEERSVLYPKCLIKQKLSPRKSALFYSKLRKLGGAIWKYYFFSPLQDFSRHDEILSRCGKIVNFLGEVLIPHDEITSRRCKITFFLSCHGNLLYCRCDLLSCRDKLRSCHGDS